ncbi:MAG: hypothetical protein MUO26_10920 [Methanotrichaceae archaeon]|nr:hypothetical protein [Methanotrichaceae archaeon]
MKWTIAFVALIGLISAASTQSMFTGEGYSTSQLAFLNEPNVPAFEPSVEKYWNTYISQTQNASPVLKGPVETMNIWMNNFPLQFSTPVTIKGTSFSANASKISGASSAELNSMLLKRDIDMNLDIGQSWQYTPVGTTLSMISQGNNTPTDDAKGLIISQSVMGSFTI